MCKRLKLNADKTEFIWLGSAPNLKKFSINAIQLGSETIDVSSTVRNLGVIFDSEMNFEAQVSSITRSSFHQLRQLRSVRRCLSTDATKILVNAFVCSCVDFCNSIYAGSAAYMHNRLQSILNEAARLMGHRKFDHISSTLQELHWLWIPQRCNYKIASITRRCLLGTGPRYLTDYLTPVSSISSRSHLRSADRGEIVVPFSRTVRAGSRSFRTSGPTIWNSLPPAVRNLHLTDNKFAVTLKTYLFGQSYL